MVLLPNCPLLGGSTVDIHMPQQQERRFTAHFSSYP